MVFDTLSNFSQYILLHPYFIEVDQFLKLHDINSLQVGSFRIGEHGIKYSINEYLTKDYSDGFIEFHKKYIDIQIVLKGREKAGICHKDECTEIEFDSENDFGKLMGEVTLIELKPNNFAIFFPQDGHMPQLNKGLLPQTVKKLVIKVPVNF